MYLLVLQRLANKCKEIYNAWRAFARLIKPFALRRFLPAAVVICLKSLLL